jgi:hypothetical protein
VSRRQIPYKIGTWFAVPLPSGGYGVGVVARANGKGEVFGYFFGPRRSTVPTLKEVSGATPKDAVLLRLFGDLGLIRGEWPILGTDPTWTHERWPMPGLLHRDDVTGKMSLRYYDEEKLGLFVREEPCDRALADSAPRDGLSGQGALEVRLDGLLCDREPS